MGGPDVMDAGDGCSFEGQSIVGGSLAEMILETDRDLPGLRSIVQHGSAETDAVRVGCRYRFDGLSGTRFSANHDIQRMERGLWRPSS